MKLKLRIDMNVSTPFPMGLYRGRLQVSDFIIMLAFILEERYTCAEHLNQATTTTTAEKHTLWHGAKSWHKKSVKNWLPFAQQSMCSTYGHYIYSSSPSISCAFAIVRKTGTQLILSFAIEVYTLLSSLSTSRNNRFSMHTAMCSLDRERTLRVPLNHSPLPFFFIFLLFCLFFIIIISFHLCCWNHSHFYSQPLDCITLFSFTSSFSFKVNSLQWAHVIYCSDSPFRIHHCYCGANLVNGILNLSATSSRMFVCYFALRNQFIWITQQNNVVCLSTRLVY